MFRRWRRPTGAPRFNARELRGFERIAVPVMHALNANEGAKNALFPVMWHWVHRYVTAGSGNLYEVHHLDRVRGLDAPRGILLVSNHRSFFDMYVTSDVLYDEVPHLMRRIYFPVRKNFFYDSPLGLLVNLAVSGGSMWPPVFRDGRRGDFNPVGLEQIAAVMQRGSVVGLHPEGKRSTLDDPWAQLPAKPGLGRLVQVCAPEVVVLPFFVLGASNDVKRVVTRNRKPAGQRGEPIRIRFGEPMRAGELLDRAAAERPPQAAVDPMAVVSPVMAEIARLAAEDKADWLSRAPERRTI